MMNKLKFLLLSLLITSGAWAQELTLQEYLSWVVREHPMMQSAELKTAIGDAQLLQVKGLFDPVLESKFKQKFFSGTNYYTYSTTGITYPTPYAVSLISQIDVNNGYYLNPLDYTKNSGLFSLGVSLPVLKGLVYDERRMANHRAEKIKEALALEKSIAINEILYQSTLLYRNWCLTYERLEFTKTIREATAQRHLNMRERYFRGDKAAIDTVESFTQVTARNIQTSEAELEYIKARIALVAFLQDNSSDELSVLNAAVIPSVSQRASATSFLSLETSQLQIDNHPELQLYDNKVDILEIERRWKREKLKPKLNLEYYALQQPITPDELTPNLNNYKWGVEFSSSLFLREARGDLKLQALKIQETTYTREWKKQQLLQKSFALQNNNQQLEIQLVNSRKNTELYALLLDAENKKLNAGESNLFLVNARENSLFDSQIKQLELANKTRITQADWSYLWFQPYE